jgi:hypothetical protein
VKGFRLWLFNLDVAIRMVFLLILVICGILFYMVMFSLGYLLHTITIGLLRFANFMRMR